MCILFAILELLFGIVAAVVILSYAIAWYEYANREPVLMQERFVPGRLWFAAKLITTETLLLFVTVLLHPLGWFSFKEKPATDGGDTPVLLLHGLFHNRACWLWARFRLRNRGYKALYAINLPPWYDVERLTERVSKKVDELRHSSGVDKIHLVGHSMGGMIARNYIQLRGGEQKVEACVLLSCPNGGSKLVPFALTPLGKHLLPGSEFLQRLAAAPLPTEVRLTAIVNRHDNMILPFENGRLAGVRNIELTGMGHASVLYRSRAIEAIAQSIREPEP
ncbi:triacylglycerol lipase [Desulfuromonas sp. TF]|uniref:esterase/lipase family protein n=1 Tax=Desulfuromonas sp. TF TaxID=1232410 RepID=UPI00041F5754|nr:alpha/beta fold hydrolase [Desulfuromonas sp. TF]